MNKQNNGKGGRGIEWTDYTWNPVAGCHHQCRWLMPNGNTAVCYAETVANRVARVAYPEGFAHHYFHPERLEEPLKLKEPARIFLDSMSDLMGHWVPDEQVLAALDVCRRAPRHQFQLLTKAPKRLLRYIHHFPPNVWLGASMPPTYMNGELLGSHQQERMFEATLKVFQTLRLRVPNVLWLSLEPLSFDVSRFLWREGGAIDWVVIGAASDGPKHWQPRQECVKEILMWADNNPRTVNPLPVFMKGNLKWEPHREAFPAVKSEKEEAYG